MFFFNRTKMFDLIIERNESANCKIPQEFATSEEFYHCFQKLVDLTTMSLMLLIFLIVFLNLLVIGLILRKRSGINIFDKLVLLLCFCDTLQGLIDAPFYAIIQMFGYWPLNHSLGVFWTIFDSSINTVNMSCMLHMTYIRLRSLQVPNTFERELLVRKPLWIALFYWTISNRLIYFVVA